MRKAITGLRLAQAPGRHDHQQVADGERADGEREAAGAVGQDAGEERQEEAAELPDQQSSPSAPPNLAAPTPRSRSGCEEQRGERAAAERRQHEQRDGPVGRRQREQAERQVGHEAAHQEERAAPTAEAIGQPGAAEGDAGGDEPGGDGGSDRGGLHAGGEEARGKSPSSAM
ncbi:MAG: hypothetical protein U1F43_32875 [Myxococcota bacterium]